MASRYSGLYQSLPDSTIQSVADYERMLPYLDAGSGYVMHRARLTQYKECVESDHAHYLRNTYTTDRVIEELDRNVPVVRYGGDWKCTLAKPPVARVIWWDDLRDHMIDIGLRGSGLKAAMVCARKEVLYQTMCNEYVDGNDVWERCEDSVIPRYVAGEWERIAESSRAKFEKAGAVGIVDGKVIRFDPVRADAARAAYLNERLDALPIDGGIHAMLTITLPPAYHRLTTWDAAKQVRRGKPMPNPEWNKCMPVECMDELRKVWKRARAWWAKDGLRRGDVRACRFVEPHGDGTPHMHVLLSVRSIEILDIVVDGVMRSCFLAAGERAEYRRNWCKSKYGWQWQYTFRAKTQALARNLVKVDVMQDASGASRYVSKYVAKHTDGGLTNKVRQWLSVCNIRQYSFIGGELTKRVWDALGAAGLRCKELGRDRESGELFDNWRATELQASSKDYAVVDIDRDVREWKYELRVGGRDGETIYRAQRYNVMQDVDLHAADAAPWLGLTKCNHDASDAPLLDVGEWIEEEETVEYDMPPEILEDWDDDWNDWLKDYGQFQSGSA